MRTPWSEQDELAYVRRSFAQHSALSYGRDDAADASPLYAHLAHESAQDDDLLRLTLGANTLPQRPHLLFAAAHYLLLSGRQDTLQDTLAEYFPDLTPTPRPSGEAYPVFRAFCFSHAADIRRLITTYGVQNNEVGRCADLLLGFDEVARRGDGKPLALIELGSSAGLNMLWDQYGYEYAGMGYVGDRASPVQLACAPRGDFMPPLPNTIPTISWRIGVDLHPLDVRSDEDVRWLRALIWPEHRDRAQRIWSALGPS